MTLVSTSDMNGLADFSQMLVEQLAQLLWEDKCDLLKVFRDFVQQSGIFFSVCFVSFLCTSAISCACVSCSFENFT